MSPWTAQTRGLPGPLASRIWPLGDVRAELSSGSLGGGSGSAQWCPWPHTPAPPRIPGLLDGEHPAAENSGSVKNSFLEIHENRTGIPFLGDAPSLPAVQTVLCSGGCTQDRGQLAWSRGLGSAGGLRSKGDRLSSQQMASY